MCQWENLAVVYEFDSYFYPDGIPNFSEIKEKEKKIEVFS